jgi:hypothetical protein
VAAAVVKKMREDLKVHVGSEPGCGSRRSWSKSIVMPEDNFITEARARQRTQKQRMTDGTTTLLEGKQ